MTWALPSEADENKNGSVPPEASWGDDREARPGCFLRPRAPSGSQEAFQWKEGSSRLKVEREDRTFAIVKDETRDAVYSQAQENYPA